jgi:DNA-binding transcriptional ArsR family regulator
VSLTHSELADELRLTNPRAMRALAHPTRIAILDHLYAHGPATATQCAVVVGESPSSCSFHLRTLGKWGFVEGLPERGRERPWRPVARSIRSSSDEIDAPDHGAAEAVLLRQFARRDAQQLEAYLNHVEELSLEWREAVNITIAAVQVTPLELKELAARHREMIKPYLASERGSDIPGTRRVNVVFRAIPDIDEPVEPT